MISILKHFVIRVGAIGFIVFLFIYFTDKFNPTDSGQYPAMGFLLAVFAIAAVLALMIVGLLFAETVYLILKKKYDLVSINVAIIITVIILGLIFYDKIL